jgi:3-methyl-2-oxobutanoate hydroxymethyltransferase
MVALAGSRLLAAAAPQAQEVLVARITPDQIKQMKQRGERIPMLTCYDYPTAQLLEAAGIPMVLVGDSLGNVVLGHENTLPVTLDDMIHHGSAVVRGTKRILVVVDMPFGTFQISPEETVRNATRIIKETGAQAIKLEGGVRSAESVRALTQAGVPVMGHLGFTPQSVNMLGYRVQGKTDEAAKALLADAMALDAAGVFAIVLELVPAELSQIVTQRVSVPTIGIGGGPFCDGEVQILHDILGLYPDFTPKHTRRFGELGGALQESVSGYISAVKERTFPGEEQTNHLDPQVIQHLQNEE